MMFMSAILSSLLLVIPTYLAIMVFGASLYVGWFIVTAYIILLGFAFLIRFRKGAWREMRVIEEVPPALDRDIPGTIPE